MKNMLFYAFCCTILIILIGAQEKYRQQRIAIKHSDLPGISAVMAPAQIIRDRGDIDITLAYRNLGAFVQRYCTKKQYDDIERRYESGDITAADIRGCFIGAALSNRR